MTFLIIFLVFIIMLLLLTFAAFFITCRWYIFKKAGKNGWEALIPFYGSWIYYEISGYPGWISLLTITTIIPFIKVSIALGIIIINILAGLSIAKKFHRNNSFGILIALLPIIGLPILAFGNDTYDNNLGKDYNKKNKLN